MQHPGKAVGDVVAELAINRHAIAVVQITHVGELVVSVVRAVVGASGFVRTAQEVPDLRV